jgi:hypothetical protein
MTEDQIRRIKSKMDYAKKLPHFANKPLTDEEKESAFDVVKLSVLIATTEDRRLLFNNLFQEFRRQIEMNGLTGKGKYYWLEEVEYLDSEGKPIYDGEVKLVYYIEHMFKYPDIVQVLFEEDRKEMSIGAKRQKLLDRARGKYIVYFDSDDKPRDYYLTECIKAIDENAPDCIGFKILMTTNGDNPQLCEHSLKHKKWIDRYNKDGITYARNVTHFNPVRRELAQQAGFTDTRYGEDRIYSDKLTPLCKTETYIDKIMFDYRYSNHVPHNQKYGIER